MVCFPPIKWSQKNGPKNSPKNGQKNGPKSGPKIFQKNGPVHILPWAKEMVQKKCPKNGPKNGPINGPVHILPCARQPIYLEKVCWCYFMPAMNVKIKIIIIIKQEKKS